MFLLPFISPPSFISPNHAYLPQFPASFGILNPYQFFDSHLSGQFSFLEHFHFSFLFSLTLAGSYSRDPHNKESLGIKSNLIFGHASTKIA